MNEAIVTGSSTERNTKPEQTLKNLRLNMWRVASYCPRPLGRMGMLDSYYSRGEYTGDRGYHIGLTMCVSEDRSTRHSHDDPSVSVLVPTKRYSKKEYWHLLLKLDPIAPELCAAFEADPVAGAASFKQRMQELFGASDG